MPTVDIETLTDGVSEVKPGDSLCTACWALFDGTDSPTCPACGEMVPSDGWSSLPYRFLDRYEFLDLLGRGGVGAVFRARHVDESRGEQQFAVKIVQQGAQPERRRLLSQIFEREISAAALVGRSRHFVRVLGHDTGDHLHLAMEYVPWPTLKLLLKQKETLPPRDVAKLGIALLRALEVMHAHNLVHRDLKPANIFVTTEDGEFRIKIADLGLWLLAEEHRGDVTESLPAGTFAGTLDYASPEQMDGIDISLRSDLHAVGSILWAAATSDVPFPAMGATFLGSMKSRRQLVEAIPARPPTMPSPLYDVLSKALQPNVEDRFSSAQKFAEALEVLVQDTEAFDSTVHLRSTPRRSSPPKEKRESEPSSPERLLVQSEPSKPPLPRWPLVVGGGVVVLLAGYFALSALPGSSETTETLDSPPGASLSSVPTDLPSTGPKLASLVLGERHTCARIENGELACWGANERGQLGDGTTTSRSQPVRVTALRNVEEVALGRSHTCGRTKDGSVWCWGSNDLGQLGEPSESVRAAPLRMDGLPPIQRIFVGGCQSYGITAKGEVWNWGCSTENGNAKTPATPRHLPELDGARSIQIWEQEGAGIVCALFDDRSPSCHRWGKKAGVDHASAVGQLGPVTQLAFARNHGCARAVDGKISCWGRNDTGQVGDGTRQTRLSPVQIPGADDAKQVIVGEGYACIRTESGECSCWGRNGRGQAGGRGVEDRLVPSRVEGLGNVRSIAMDQGRSCAVTEQGRVGCWGAGFSDGKRDLVWMGGMDGSSSIFASGAGVLCSILESGGAACFGNDEIGQLGVGRSLRREPTRVPSIERVGSIRAAARNACAVDETSELFCWGHGAWGAFDEKQDIVNRPLPMGKGVLDVAMGSRGIYAWVTDEEDRRKVFAGGILMRDHGIGASAKRTYPQPVPDLNEAKKISVGSQHGCALMANGTVSCWGNNSYGQLGEGSPSSRMRPTPALIEGEVIAVASGGFHACALRKNGTVLCWGSNRNGQTGPGPTWTCIAGRNTYPCVRRPRRVIGIQDAVALAAGQWHNCALLTSGKVMCWGANGFGQLGDGSTQERPSPQPIRDVSNAMDLSVGEKHACSVLRDGAVWCWGNNVHGELGRPTTERCGGQSEPCGLAPAPVLDMSDAVRVATGWEFSCALRKDGTVWCWGSNQRGTLGTGEPVYREEPVVVKW